MIRLTGAFGLLFACLLSCPLTAQPCNGVLFGSVLDDHDRTRLEYAAVYIQETGQRALSDSAGSYRIENICDGTYTVHVSHLGCEDLFQRVTIQGVTRQDFHPEHHAEELRSLQITADRIPDRSTQATGIISGAALDRTRGLSLAESIRGISGVQVLNTGNSIAKPVIHGLHSNRVLVVANGVRQESQQWGSEHAPEVDPFIASELKVVKGAAGVRYASDAIAGVVIAEPKPLRDTIGWNGELNLVGMTNGRAGTVSGMMEGNHAFLPSLSWRLQGTLKRSGNVQTPDYYLKNTGLTEADFSAALQWQKDRYGASVFYSQFNTTLGIFSASHIGNLTDLEKAFTSDRPLETSGFTYDIERPYQHIEHEMFKSQAWWLTGNSGKLMATVARQYNLRYEYDKHLPLNDSLAGLNLPQLQFQITSYTADLVWEHYLAPNMSGSIGLTGMSQTNTTEGRQFIPNYENRRGGAFIMERYKTGAVEWEAGLRYEAQRVSAYRWIYQQGGFVLTNPQRQFENISGTFGFLWKPNEGWTVSLNTGTAWRAPAVSELYCSGLHHGAAAIEYGDPDLQVEKSFNTIMDITYDDQKRWHASLSLYYNPIRDFIYLSPELPPTLTIQGAFPTYYYRQTDALLKGIDADFRYRFADVWQMNARGSILRARDVLADQWLVMMPADRVEGGLSWLVPDRFGFLENSISLSAQYVAYQSRVPANSDFVPPPPAYLLFHAELATTMQVRNQSFEVSLSVRNLMNTSYRDYMDRFRYYADAMGRNIILRLRIPFN